MRPGNSTLAAAPGGAGREVRFTVRPERLDATARSLAAVASQWDARLAVIKRIAEAAEG